MKLFDLIKTFAQKEDGAVTVDWVVITAAICLLGIGLLTAISGSVNNVATGIANVVQTQVPTAPQ